MESSTTNATTGIRTLKRRKDQVAILEQRLFDQNNTQRWRESYHRHVRRANLCRTCIVMWAGAGLGFFGLRALFDGHVLEFTGLKDVAAFDTLDVLGVLIAADNLHARVLTLIHDPSLLGGLRRRLAS